MPVLSPTGLIAMNGGTYEWPQKSIWQDLTAEMGPYVAALRWFRPHIPAFTHQTGGVNRIKTRNLITEEVTVYDAPGPNQLVAGGGVWASFSSAGYADSHGERGRPWFPQCVDDLTGDVCLTIDQSGHDLHVWDGTTLTPIMAGIGFASSFSGGVLVFRLNNVWYHWTRAEGVKTIGRLQTLLGGALWSNGWNLGWFPPIAAQVIWADWTPEQGVILCQGINNFNAAICRETASDPIVTVVGSRGPGELAGEQQVFTINLANQTVDGQPWQVINLRTYTPPPDPPVPPIPPIPPVPPVVEETDDMPTLLASHFKPYWENPATTVALQGDDGRWLQINLEGQILWRTGVNHDGPNRIESDSAFTWSPGQKTVTAYRNGTTYTLRVVE